MARPTRTKVDYSKKALGSLLQEVYIDSHNFRAKLASNFQSLNKKIKDVSSKEDAEKFLDKSLEFLKLESKSIDNKIFLITHIADELSIKK